MNIENFNLGLGTAAIGRPQYINIRHEQIDPVSLDDFRKKGWFVLEHAYNQGIRYFDTAPGYGLAEGLLIDWIKTKDDPTIQVATKWGYTYTANFDPNAIQHEIKEHSLPKLNEQWEISRKLLPYLKIYQIHSATFESGILENEVVLERLLELKNEYEIEIGITTTGINQVDVIKRALDIQVKGVQLFDSFQVTYNILDQSISDITKILKEQSKKVIIKEALANGRLLPNSNYTQYQNLYNELHKLSNKYQVGPDAIALRFCMDTLQPNMVLSGGAYKKHITDNLQVGNFQLDHKEIILLKSFLINPMNYWKERKELSWN